MSSGPCKYDLWVDPHIVDGDLVGECEISRGPRADDPSFDPQVGDDVLIGDDDEEGVDVLHATVLRREGISVWVKIKLPSAADADADAVA